ncbi:KRSC protein, partial [Rhinopomastus cyanomelas]|nr:KRSC protein [Rhinopomastus cyanomelas]
ISSRCLPACEATCPQPYICSTSLEPCVTTCGDSRAVVYGPPVLLTFPGPILRSCPQESFVGSSLPETYSALPSYRSGSNSVMGSSYGSGGTSGIGGSISSGSVSGMGGSYGSGGLYGYGGNYGSG